MNLQNRIYLSSFINSFGSWLTFLAIALIVKEKYGADHVAWVFLVQTLPAILFSRGISSLIAPRNQAKIYSVLQFVMAGNCLLLVFNQSLGVIYLHLFLGAFLKSVSIPLFNTLIGRLTPSDRLQQVFTKVGAIQTSTLALAPIAGAWLKIVTSANVLFLADAVTFILSILLIWQALRSLPVVEDSVVRTVTFKSLFNDTLSVPKGVPSELKFQIVLWLTFLALGALLNALEFTGFERIGMSEQEVGFALAAWGLGSLLSMALKLGINGVSGALLYTASIVLFLFAPNTMAVLISFAIGGWATSHLSGMIRAKIQKSVPDGYDALPVWAFVNQMTQILNLVAYAGVGLLLQKVGFGVFGTVTFLVGLLMVSLIFVDSGRRFFKKGDEQWT